jgi:xylan 1,4-beta-xylosidase
MLRLKTLLLAALLGGQVVAATRPAVWIITDMSDKTLPGDNHMGTLNDPDDISAMAGYLLLANEFDTRGIVVASTHRSEHANTPDQADWADQVFGKAYRAEVSQLTTTLGGGFPADISFIQSCIKATAERYDPARSYVSLEGYGSIRALFDEMERQSDGSVLNVLCWGSLTEPAILVNHCLTTGRTDLLKRIRFIAHWTDSSLHQGTAEHPERVANCQEDAKACAYLKQVAKEGLIDYRECGAIGQHGIVSGAPRTEGYYDAFKVSRLGRLFVEGKFVHGSPDHSDSATYWTLLGNMGVRLDDLPPDGSNSPLRERTLEQKFRASSAALHDELLRRSRAAVSPQTEVSLALEAHDRAVLIHPQPIRDPFITLQPDGWYYLTGTTLGNEPDGVVGIPVWRSRDLSSWEALPRLWRLDQSAWIDLNQPIKHQSKKLLVWAPELHRVGNRWAIVHTTNNGFANLLRTSGPDLAPPLEEPMGSEFGSHHDPSIVTEEDGTPWLVWGVLSLQPLRPDLSGFAGPRLTLAPRDRKMGHEGSAVLRIGGRYVWFGTAWSTDQMRKGTYNLYYATAEKLTGPYGPRRFAGRFLGHGTPFQDKQGRWWCTAFFNANHPPLTNEEARTRDLSDDAFTINRQGTTLVPMDVRIEADGDVTVRAKALPYASPGPEEVQTFSP